MLSPKLHWFGELSDLKALLSHHSVMRHPSEWTQVIKANTCNEETQENQSSFTPPPISTKLRSEIVLTHPLVPCDEMCRDKRRTNWCGETLRPGTVSSTTGNSETSNKENKMMEMLYSDLSLTVKKKKTLPLQKQSLILDSCKLIG